MRWCLTSCVMTQLIASGINQCFFNRLHLINNVFSGQRAKPSDQTQELSK